MLKRILAAAAVTAAGISLALVGGPAAHATTLTCTGVANQTVPPFGCGGDQLAYTAKGTLDLAVLGGNYWNSPVGFATDSTSASTEDWTVFAVNGSTTDGPGFLGEYVAVYTPDGKFASFTQSGTAYTNAVPKPGQFTVGTNVYAMSVENLHDGPKGALRWHTILRTADSNGTFMYGTNTTSGAVSSTGCASQTKNNCISESRANAYQVWAPVSGASGLLMVNDSLSHGFKSGNTPYVLDDRSFGGSGTPALAFPENDGLNQESAIIGCTEPITGLNTSYSNCP